VKEREENALVMTLAKTSDGITNPLLPKFFLLLLGVLARDISGSLS
jgi:hypothetical protein